MYYSQKPWRAHDTLFWFTVLGLGIATFAGLVAICALAIGLTPWEIVVVRQAAAQPVAVTATGELQIPLIDQLCLTDQDCTTTITVCGGCSCGSPVNVLYAAKYQQQLPQLCQAYTGPFCQLYCLPQTPRCINQRCALNTR